MFDFFKKEKPFQGYTGYGGGAASLATVASGVPSILTVPTGVSGPGYWNLRSQGNLTLNLGATYDIGVAPAPAGGGDPVSVTIHMWGAGGSGGRADTPSPQYSNIAGGGGGYTTGSMTLSSGTTYKAVVGNAKGNTVDASPWGEPAASGNPISPPYNGPNPWVPTCLLYTSPSPRD